MTNEDLLQQAKDQVAKEKPNPGRNRNYYNFEDLCECVSNGWVGVQTLIDCSNAAALLAIQSAREEALKGYKDIIAIEEPDGSYGHDDYQRGLLKGLAEAKELAKQAIEKLTAPGR